MFSFELCHENVLDPLAKWSEVDTAIISHVWHMWISHEFESIESSMYG